MFGFGSRIRLSDCQYWSIVPSGTDTSLKTLTQHFVLGYFRQVPTGPIFTEFPTTCAILIATCYNSRACEAAGAFSALFSDRQFPNRITDADGARNDDLGIETTQPEFASDRRIYESASVRAESLRKLIAAEMRGACRLNDG
jgi:hypothetical protein